MFSTPCLADRQPPPASPMPPGKRERHRARRRFDRSTPGLGLGGVSLGLGGGLLGACLPYHHPVAVVLSVLWWRLYFGCFGASRGAGLGVCTEGTPAPPSLGPEGAGQPPPGVDHPALPAGVNGCAHGVNRAPNSARHSPTLSWGRMPRTRGQQQPLPGLSPQEAEAPPRRLLRRSNEALIRPESFDPRRARWSCAPCGLVR
jgi:hypothetical protein